MPIGSKIRAAREVAELRQDDLASRVGTSQSHISQIEAGIKYPSVPLLRAIAQELSLDLNDALGVADAAPTSA